MSGAFWQIAVDSRDAVSVFLCFSCFLSPNLMTTPALLTMDISYRFCTIYNWIVILYVRAVNIWY